MFDLSPEKILLIGVIALMVLGPDRLPKAARGLGKALHQMRTMTGSLQTEVRDAMAEPRQALNDAVGDMGLPTTMPRIPSVRSALNQALFEPVEASSRNPFAPGEQASASDGASVDRASALPDDPALN